MEVLLVLDGGHSKGFGNGNVVDGGGKGFGEGSDGRTWKANTLSRK